MNPYTDNKVEIAVRRVWEWEASCEHQQVGSIGYSEQAILSNQNNSDHYRKSKSERVKQAT